MRYEIINVILENNLAYTYLLHRTFGLKQFKSWADHLQEIKAH